MEFITTNLAPIMFGGLMLFLLLGFPVAFSLGACGLFFGFVGIELGVLPQALLQALPLRSKISPISVKKGMASKVSFCMMPMTRNGNA